MQCVWYCQREYAASGNEVRALFKNDFAGDWLHGSFREI